ncbi:hypothetical protein AAFF_G00143000 [Aldrovandia affinis]|uniref:BTB domain-containing protein n=1 Tax=Aldrovandia affinis TaxID=143900 RepID=A0AAD7WWY8_9TELE|nr:hypothetical protein AAFF_G00143000 [Aldrovandia affinis]
MAKREESEKIVINVGGVRHETYKSTLETLPGTRLARLSDVDGGPGSVNEFFFDRHPGMFAYILNYYRTGNLHFPTDTCGCLFEKELAFWGINETDMESCCWESYCEHRDRIKALRELGPSNPEGGEDSQDRSRPLIAKVWALFDDPHSSWAAKTIAVLSLIFILVSITNTCLETHPFFQLKLTDDYIQNGEMTSQAPEITEPEAKSVFFILEAVCTVWFTFEFLVRVVCCPNKLLFIKNALNIIDFLAILPFYLEVWHFHTFNTVSAVSRNILGLVRVSRFVRLLRIFKLMSSFLFIQLLGHTLRASLGQFCILSAFLALGSFIFGSLFLYAECLLDESRYSTRFSILDGAWWALISLTTLGYGDIYPETWLGRIVGGLCVLASMLTLALPISALVTNFNIYHSLVMAKQKLSKRERHNPKQYPSALALQESGQL